MTTMMPPSFANQLVPSASSRAEIALMRSFIVGLGAGVRRGENGGGVEMRAVAAGGIAAGCGGGITGVCGTPEGGDIFGSAAGGVGCAAGGGTGGAGTRGLGSAGFGSSGTVTDGTGREGAGTCGFCSGKASGFFSVTGIEGAVCGLIGGWASTRGGTATGEGNCICG